MKFSISNIAWLPQDSVKAYNLLKENGFTGLEIAPSLLIEINPYQNTDKAKSIAHDLLLNYGLSICSLQSILYGCSKNIFGSEEDKIFLSDYIKQSILFAESVGAPNIVFGAPVNRMMPENKSADDVLSFFFELGEFSLLHQTFIALEPNPKIYNTNFLNTTQETINFVNSIGSSGVRLNLDIGTMLVNNENLSIIQDHIELINHIHISEPNLKPLESHEIHSQLKNLLIESKYSKYISIEIKNFDNSINNLRNSIKYFKGVFIDN